MLPEPVQDVAARARRIWFVEAHGISFDMPQLRRLLREWLEANAGERLGEYLSLIAGHYELANEKVKAVAYLRRSGEDLLRMSAARDAIDVFERALSLLPEGAMLSTSDMADRAAQAVAEAFDERQPASVSTRSGREHRASFWTSTSHPVSKKVFS